MSSVFYFSGLSGATEANVLKSAGVDHVLVDPKDLGNAQGFGHVALDSGAYRAFKKGESLNIPNYLQLATSGEFDFFVAPDVIGDPQASHDNWETHKRPGMVPVWQWGGDEGQLTSYLDEANIVGIGGLVQLMRDKDEKMLKKLIELCERHPGRLHLFGANWLKAINTLKECAYSMDTSKFLDAARYGHLIFIHEKTGKLHQAPAKVLGKGDMTREDRLIASARAMNEYTNQLDKAA